MISYLNPGYPSRLFSFAAAAASALLLILGMPGRIGWWPLLFIALTPLLLAVRRLPAMRCACMGLFCGLLYNIGLLYWIVIVLGRYGGLPVWISVPGMTLLALYMGCYLGLFCLLLNLVIKRSRAGKGSTGRMILAAPILWVGLDYLRSFLFSGFPWMDLGYGLYQQPLLIQAADLGGHHLVTFCIVLLNALLVWLFDQSSTRVPETLPGRRVPVVFGCILLAAVSSYSFWRYQQISTAVETGPKATVAVVQGNISQDEKWTPARKEETVDTYLGLSRSLLEHEELELMVWPETALPFYPQQDPLMEKVLDFVREKKVQLLTGAPWFVLKTEKKAGRKPVDYFNSGLLIDASGKPAGRYDKQHLVPFGEYVPIRSYLPFLEPLVVSVGDFTAGSSYEPLQTGNIRAGVLICFESIFPAISRREVEAGSNLLVNLTNDAWYGRSSAPYHSLAMSVFRAVETRRSLVRAANTGISGFVEPSGIIRAQSRLFEPAALMETVVLLSGQTFFTSGGYWFGSLCLAMIVPLLLLRRRH